MVIDLSRCVVDEWFNHAAPRTWLVSVTPGFRVPIGWADPEAGLRGSLLAGVGLSHLADARDDETFLQLAAGGEIVW